MGAPYRYNLLHRLSLLRPTKPYLNFDSALRFYNSCVVNYFINCSASWGNCSHHLFLWLLRLQKRAGRILLDAEFSSASLSLIFIPVFYLIKYKKAFLLFSILRNPNAPNYLRNRFQFLSDSRGPLGRYIWASLFNLKVPYPQVNSGKRTLAYSATKLFNELSSDLKEFSTSSSPPTFKFLPSFHKSNLRNLEYLSYSNTPLCHFIVLLIARKTAFSNRPKIYYKPWRYVMHL